MGSARTGPDLVRSATDEQVLRALMDRKRLTRAELAAWTGFSKPTTSESVRRLEASGLVADTGERTTGRGRVGSYYALADAGCALVLGVAPEGVIAQAVDPHGEVVARVTEQTARPAQSAQVGAVIRSVAARARKDCARPFRVATVSAADPVNRSDGRLVHLPDAPFLIGELAPAELLGDLVESVVDVDNDVNWAARAERGADPYLTDFAYLHLGEGLGCAVVGDGVVRRGHAGLVGEIAHVLTRGVDGAAAPFTELFRALDLRRPGSTAIDVAALRAVIEAGDDRAARVGGALASGVAGVVAAVVAFVDPEVVVVGGEWGHDETFLDLLTGELRAASRPVTIRAASVTDEPALAGARAQALHGLREWIVAAARARPARQEPHSGIPGAGTGARGRSLRGQR